MTMYASQKINTDPEPWVSRIDASKRGDIPDAFPERIGTWGVDHEPRPEFDNNPNPILVAFREFDRARACSTTGHSAALELQRMAWDAERDTYTYWNDLPEIPTYAQMTHARKVLERLVAQA
ncbi:hypothetical protein ACSHWG_00790 [Leucobacter sp. Z1108]|uniref:hypothetical protein n=1 Tax=Leucobacter sp. Z1108 TaxID=3439066 RepID=UPI003F3D069E